MSSPNEHQARPSKREEKSSLFGLFSMGIMLLVLVGSIVQLLAGRPGYKAAFLVMILAGGSLLLVFQLIRGGEKSGQVRPLKMDYEDPVMMEYLGMDDAYMDDDLDQRLKRSGERGEQQVMHALSWLPAEQFVSFNQVYVSAKGRVQQFDHLVVGHNGIFHIETKNHAGRIAVTPEGNWEITRTISGKSRTEGMESPLEQIRRHEIVLKDFLDELLGRHKIPIQEIVVIANAKTTVKGEQNSPFVILKRDKLLDYILNYGKPGAITPDNRRRIVKALEKRSKRIG